MLSNLTQQEKIILNSSNRIDTLNRTIQNKKNKIDELKSELNELEREKEYYTNLYHMVGTLANNIFICKKPMKYRFGRSWSGRGAKYAPAVYFSFEVNHLQWHDVTYSYSLWIDYTPYNRKFKYKVRYETYETYKGIIRKAEKNTVTLDQAYEVLKEFHNMLVADVKENPAYNVIPFMFDFTLSIDDNAIQNHFSKE